MPAVLSFALLELKLMDSRLTSGVQSLCIAISAVSRLSNDIVSYNILIRIPGSGLDRLFRC